jgi:hypothetical protein
MYSLYRREHYRTLSHRRLCHRGRAGDAPDVGKPHTDSPALKGVQANVCFSNRPVWVKRFQAIHQYSVDVARRLVLLFGIGTKALP